MALGARLRKRATSGRARRRAPWWGSYIAAMDHAASATIPTCRDVSPTRATKNSEHSAAMFRHHPSADKKHTAVPIYNSASVQLHRPATRRLDKPPPRLFVAITPLPPANSMSNIGAAVAGDFQASYLYNLLSRLSWLWPVLPIGLTIFPRPRHLTLTSPSARSCHSSSVLVETPRAALSQRPIQTT